VCFTASIVLGLRHVVPYVHEYRAFAKQRWFGRTILDIYVSEFGGYSEEYYVSLCGAFSVAVWVWRCQLVSVQRQAIEDGRIRLRGKRTTPTAVLKNGDWQSHIIHRHEPPVAGLPIVITHECDDFVRVCTSVVVMACCREAARVAFQVVVSKPASIPMHPCGAYRFNSLVRVAVMCGFVMT
jgi:tRNA pseudouridine32 synthase